MRVCWMGSVHCASWTVAGVVWTWVRRCGAVGSHVSLTCTMYPVHWVSRLWRERGSPPLGDSMPSVAGGHSPPGVLHHRYNGDTPHGPRSPAVQLRCALHGPRRPSTLSSRLAAT